MECVYASQGGCDMPLFLDIDNIHRRFSFLWRTVFVPIDPFLDDGSPCFFDARNGFGEPDGIPFDQDT